MSNLILLAGIPGCGKSTYAKTFFDLKYAIVSSDEIRKRLAGSLKDAHDKNVRPWDAFYADIEEKLLHSVDVIADATFLTTRHRTRAREIAECTHATLHLILFTNLIAASMRNHERDEDAQVSGNVMDDMCKLYQQTLAALPHEHYASVTKIAAFDVA